MPQPPHDEQHHTTGYARALTITHSFGYAWSGVRYLFATQRNAKIHATAGVAAVALAALLRITLVEWAVLVLTIALVITLEGVNTAVEAVVDLASPSYHPLAKIAKDVAAGTTLIAAVAAVAVGLLLFGPRLLALVVA